MRNYLDRRRKEAGGCIDVHVDDRGGPVNSHDTDDALGGPPALLLPLAMAGMLPLIHYFQVEEVKYDYSIPLAAGAIAGGVAAFILLRGYAYPPS